MRSTASREQQALKRELLMLLAAIALTAPLVVQMVAMTFGLPFHLMPADGAPARHPGPVHLRRALLPRRVEGPPGEVGQHGRARRARHERGLLLQLLPARPARPRCHWPPLLRGIGGRHHAGDARQVPGGPGQARHDRRHPPAHEPASADGARPARGRHRERDAGKRSAAPATSSSCGRASASRWTARSSAAAARSTSR